MAAGTKVGIAGDVIRLPKGGGAIAALGEKFSPDLQTGTGAVTLPIGLPAGREAFRPELSLTYSSGHGSSVFGYGWSLSVPGIARKTSSGVPRYGDDDVFILSGSEDLVRVGGDATRARYRPRIEGLFAEIVHYRDGRSDFWEVRSRDGLVSRYGTERPVGAAAAWRDPAAVADPEDARRVAAWRLTATTDGFGNRIEYRYEREPVQVDGPHHWDQLYLAEVRYADHTAEGAASWLVTVGFHYESRPDPFSEYRNGFEIRTTRRCTQIDVTAHAGAPTPVRSYRLRYADQSSPGDLPLNRVSMLTEFDVMGQVGARSERLPTARFRYSGFHPDQRDFIPFTGPDLPPCSLARPEFELADLFGTGLPDVIELDSVVRYWRNLGGGRFDRPVEMADAPAGFKLGDSGVQLIDADGDGRIDLLVSTPSLAGYFPSRFGGTWDRKSFQPFAAAPSFNLEDPEVKLVDIDGDGVTDAIRSGARFECFLNDRERGWHEVIALERGPLESFPNVSFSDPRVKWADMSGDGLQDIVLVHDGAVEYWPSLGRGRFAQRVRMANSPRLPDRHDPKRVLLGDLDGDGVADLVYVDDNKVTLWINRGGNSWSDPIELHGTPSVTDMDGVRIADMLGTGTAGILWTSDADGLSPASMFFLDLTGASKPYLLTEMDNGRGAIVRVGYASSTSHFLRDQATAATSWRTTLPFPVQVVTRVETIDALSLGKLTTEYTYHHGYWDGLEREFRGFARVDHRDTEEFERYHAAPGVFAEVDPVHYAEATETRSWFHVGPIGDDRSDWRELGLADEYWADDVPAFPRLPAVDALLAALPRPARRDALRAWKGQLLRSELYALDRTERAHRPYTTTEHTLGLRQEWAPRAAARDRWHVFFTHIAAERVTQWERGNDPLHVIKRFYDHDEYGLSRSELDIAVPRGRDFTRPAPPGQSYLCTLIETAYARPGAGGPHAVDRVASVTTWGIENDGSATLAGLAEAVARGALDRTLEGRTHHHYDGPAFEGLPLGQIGAHGALVRSETMAFTNDVLERCYRSADAVLAPAERPPYLVLGAPAWGAEYPAGFRGEVPAQGGYLWRDGAGVPAGWYVATERRRYDFHDSLDGRGRGLIRVKRNALGEDARITYDAYELLPTAVEETDGLVTTATYDYRVMQPRLVTDPNGNRTLYAFSPLGFLESAALMGKEAEPVGDTPDAPSMRLVNDFLAWQERGQPMSVRSIRRAHYLNDLHVPPGQRDETVETVEYCDGFGRLLQLRAQAEDLVFGDPISGELLPPSVAAAAGNAVGTLPPAGGPRVRVSGWQVYDNKGRVVASFAPFHSAGWEYRPATLAERQYRTETFYDPLGQPLRVRRPDGGEMRTVHGRPLVLDDPERFVPTPWERYDYDANDNAGRTHGVAAASYQTHWNTPVSIEIDALGRQVRHTARLGPSPADWITTRSSYDLRGNLVATIDGLGRVDTRHEFDLINRKLRSEQLDAGVTRVVIDPLGGVFEQRDSKGALVLQAIAAGGRVTHRWMRNTADGAVSLRERLVYGHDAASGIAPVDARAAKLLGRLQRSYDEAGLVTIERYDFRGNPVETIRRTVSDATLSGPFAAPPPDWSIPVFNTSWEPPAGVSLEAFAEGVLDPTPYRMSSRFDALQRADLLLLPEDVAGERRRVVRRYDRSGALRGVDLDATPYVRHTAYDARGRITLIVFGSGVMTRQAWDPALDRLLRLRSEAWVSPAPNVYQPAGSVLQDYGYTYDLAGNVIAIEDRAPGSGLPADPNHILRTLVYDPLYRLKRATGRECSVPLPGAPWDESDRCIDVNATREYREQYDYDFAGNLTELRHVVGGGGGYTRTIALAPGSNRLAQVTSGLTARAYGYDAAGNLTAETSSRRFEWDHADRMRTFRTQVGNAEPTVHAQYLYDAGGHRIKRLVRRGAVVETTVYIGETFERHSRTQAGDTTIHDEIQISDGRRRVASVRVGPAPPGDATPAVRYQLGDHLGSANVVVDGGGAWVNREEFTPFGETSFGGFAFKRYRFTGKERDGESGLHYFGARYYAPWLVRWVSSDPLGSADGPNPYSYVQNNPFHLIDDRGTQSEPANDTSCSRCHSTPATQKQSTPYLNDTGPWIRQGESTHWLNKVAPVKDQSKNTDPGWISSSGLRIPVGDESKAGLAPRKEYRNFRAQVLAERGYTEYAEILERGWGCTACHVTHGIGRIPTNEELNLGRLNNVAHGMHAARAILEFILTVGQARSSWNGPPPRNPPQRLQQDINVNPTPPPARPLNRPVSKSPTQNAEVQRDIAAAQAQGGRDFRVNQQQVNAQGQRVGTNRPDLQYTDANGRRVYIEYDTTSSTRGPAHQTRIQANDPNGRVILKTVN